MVWVLALGAAFLAAIIGFVLGRRGAALPVADADEEPILLTRRTVEEPQQEPVAVAVPDTMVDEVEELSPSFVDEEPSRTMPSLRAPLAAPEKPTVEFSAMLDPHEEITAQGANEMASLARATFGAAAGEVDESTSFYQPDTQTLDRLREMAANVEAAHSSTIQERPAVRSESFYIQSRVQIEERVDVRTSGFAPSSSLQSGTRTVSSAPRQAARK
jgi:hypothetical protein